MNAAFQDALAGLASTAVRGGLLAWGVLMGRMIASGFFERPSKTKIVFIAFPITTLIAAFFGFYSYRWVVDPGETHAKAIYDAEHTFFLVLLTLWIGCIWGAINPMSDKKEKQPNQSLEPTAPSGRSSS